MSRWTRSTISPARPRPIHYQLDPVQTTKTSVIGAINMLGLAKRLKVKILQASTSEVYGDPTVHPQVEDYWGNVNPIGLRSCYDEGKRCAETLFFDYVRQHKLAHQGGADFQHLWPAHASQRRPRGFEFHRPGAEGRRHHHLRRRQQTRSFCYVDDLVEAHDPHDGDSDRGHGPDQHRQSDANSPSANWPRLVIEITGSKSKLVFQPLPSDDPKQRQPNISKAEQILDWRPTIPLREGWSRRSPISTTS